MPSRPQSRPSEAKRAARNLNEQFGREEREEVSPSSPKKEECKGCGEKYAQILKHLTRGKAKEKCAPFYDLDVLRMQAAEACKAKKRMNSKERFAKTPEKQRKAERAIKYQNNRERKKLPQKTGILKMVRKRERLRK